MVRGMSWYLFIAVGVVALAAASGAVQPTPFQEAVPVTTVEPTISPLVHQGGTVVLRAQVAPTGVVSAVDVVQPYPALTEPVVAAVRQWRFAPARLNGQAVEARTMVAVHVVIDRTVIP
jgi:TonB family protein